MELVKNFPSSFPTMLAAFLLEWWNDSPYVFLQTSGSTGTPKQLRAEKVRMLQSARITCRFLGLKEGDRALLCMSLDYIAGKMMVVRALAQRLDLVVQSPSSHPLVGTDETTHELPFRFAALVPLQVFHSLQQEDEKKRLCAIDHLLIGGGAVDEALEQELRAFPHHVWATYGMTETLSHIALRQINGKTPSPYYTPLEGVTLSLSPEETLVIHAPQVCPDILITNDLAELCPDGRFRILGRKDNVICSGGIKIRIEEVERVLKPLLPFPFAVSWIPDARLGQSLVLLLEQPESEAPFSSIQAFSDVQPLPGLHTSLNVPASLNIDPLSPPGSYERTSLLEELSKKLPAYWKLQKVFTIAQLPLTETGKPARKKIQHYCTDLAKT